MGALLIPPPVLTADAVRADGAGCIGAEFIDELPAEGAPVDVDGAGSTGVVVGPLK